MQKIGGGWFNTINLNNRFRWKVYLFMHGFIERFSGKFHREESN